MAFLPDKVFHDMKAKKFDLCSLRKKCYETQTVKGIDYIDSPISYEEFFIKYLSQNKACIFGPWATESWQSRKEWVNSCGQPDLDYLKAHFGDMSAPIANCNQELFSSHMKEEKPFSEYVDYMKRYRESTYDVNYPCLYLKDWHFVRNFPNYIAYQTPQYFISDWLNEFWDHRKDNSDDYRFVYIGPKGSWTPFHSDVMRSHSWSANICGRKQWTFFKPGDEVLLQDRYGNLAFDLRSKELADSSKYPRAEEGLTMHRIEVIQNPGEVIFVPSQWHHQVVNLEDTISINHNWLCGCNVDLCWRYIQTQLVEVKSEIADCEDMDEWPQQCQLILKASSGIDYAEFFKFMHIIGERRLELLEALLKPEATREDEDEAVGSNIGSLKCNECAGNSNVSHEIVRPRRELQTKDEHCNKEFLDGCCKEEQAYTVGADVIFLEHMNNPKDDSVKVQQNIACNKQCNKVCDVEVKSNTLEDEICKKVGKTNVSNSSVADRGLQPAEHHATCQTAQKQSQDATNVIRLDLRGATHGEVQAVTSSGDKNFKQSENTCNETDMVQVERNCLENTIGYCRHLWFDMVQVASIVQDMLDDRDFQQLDTSSWDIQPSQWKLTLDEKIAYYENLLDFDLLS